MINLRTVSTVLILNSLSFSSHAATIGLFDWGFNVDGTTYCNLGPCDNDGVAPGTIPGIDVSGFDFLTGLGSIEFSISAAGSHSLVGYFDHEIDEPINTFFNETGFTSGTAAAGQSWEVDEPGFLFGNIFDNFVADTLENSNDLSGIFDDMAMAMGFDFLLTVGETATVSFNLSETNDAGGLFALEQYDPDSDASIFFWSDISITGQPPMGLAEPGTLSLLSMGLIGIACARRRRMI
jgi:hypothetical protein